MEEQQQRFRGTWTPVIGEQQQSQQEWTAVESRIVLKLEYGGTVRLVEVGEPLTMVKIGKKFSETFGKESLDFSYSLPGDADSITMKTDDDADLAHRFGGKPLKVVAVDNDDVSPSASSSASEDFVFFEEGLNVYEYASKSLAANDLSDASPDDIKRFLAILQLSERRLVKYGLAPHQILKNKKHHDDDDEVPVVDSIDKLDIEDKVPVAEEVPVSAEEDAIASAFRQRGVLAMSSTTIHALVRILDVPPRRFVKLGLVSDLATARDAYKCGGRDAADVLFKHGDCGGKKWGRGLCGGRGRGRGHGWMFDQGDVPDKKKHKMECKHWKKDCKDHHRHHGHFHAHYHGPRGHFHVHGDVPDGMGFGHHGPHHGPPPHGAGPHHGPPRGGPHWRFHHGP